ncbi:putative one transmembrane helix protein [Natrialba phage PhiCh1]|uniref:Virus protein phiCh1-VP92 n=2 Tax=root TaxID=1 RepID=D3T2E3_NATMM|nr:hypothetical protein [Natrialba magadii]NP_666010.1 putative one transmembrane helix protein [Natrialba phage PhiCh1]YP_010078119.1 transmembrane domain protein [Natrialba phage PhiCh1]AAM88766.1 putative one transmembrane helix protein [Natrialba phage PhiCh1]ADD07752.1 virus protein phiCh1-VP92 [Natrialba magadii ATCC 43099]QBJ01270.1 transmembrane domain protein [Natrialba phage PhiCh1]
MKIKQTARALAGFATVITLLALIVADTVHPQIALGTDDKVILITLIGALLGVDRLLRELPLIEELSDGLSIEIAPNSKEDDDDD